MKVYINDDISKIERKIHKKLKKATEEKHAGKDVQVVFQKIIINGKVWEKNNKKTMATSKANDMEKVNLGTWKVRGTFETSKLRELTR